MTDLAFSTGPLGALAAAKMQAVIRRYNATLSEARQHFKLKLNGVAVACGLSLIQI